MAGNKNPALALAMRTRLEASRTNVQSLVGQAVSDAARIGTESGLENFAVSELDLKLLLLLRMVGYGEVTVRITEGQPTLVERSVERIDLTKEDLLTRLPVDS